MRKLLALFCALGMLVPSVAMATFGNTFGTPYTWSAHFHTGDTDVVDPGSIEMFGFRYFGDAGGIHNFTSGADTWTGLFTVPVRSGDIIADAWCMTGHPLTSAGSSTVLKLGAWLVPDGTAAGSGVKGAQVGSDWSFCDGDCGTVFDDNKVTVDTGKAIVNQRMGADGSFYFGAREWVADGASDTQINCTVVFKRG
jgi:hypothetical protein